MNDPKLAAFTLMETIVALLLTSILIGFAYSSLRLVKLQARRLTSKTVALNEALRFDRALQADTRHSQVVFIYRDEQGAGLRFMPEKGPIQYLATDSAWIRITAIAPADTFRIRPDSLHAWLNGLPQQRYGGLADEVTIYSHNDEGQERFELSKCYDADQLIRLTDTTDEWN